MTSAKLTKNAFPAKRCGQGNATGTLGNGPERPRKTVSQFSFVLSYLAYALAIRLRDILLHNVDVGNRNSETINS